MDQTPLIAIGLVVAGLAVAGIILARGALRRHRMWAVLDDWKAEAKRANPKAPANPRFDFYRGTAGIGDHISCDGGKSWRSLNQRELDVLKSMGMVPKE